MPTTTEAGPQLAILQQVVVTGSPAAPAPAPSPTSGPGASPPSSDETIPAGQHVSIMGPRVRVSDPSCWGAVKQGWRRHTPRGQQQEQQQPDGSKHSVKDTLAAGDTEQARGSSGLTDASAATSTALAARRPAAPHYTHAQACWNAAKGVGHSCASTVKSTLHIFRLAPSCWVAPLLLLMLMLGLGIWGVEQGAQAETDHMRDVAIAAADGIAKSFELQLQQTYAPCVTLALMVYLEPQWPKLRGLFLSMAPSLMAQVPSDSLLEIQFAPQGIITDSYPADPAAEGKDLFTVQNRRSIAIETVQQGTLTVAGPLQLFRGGLGLMARIPIFLDNQTASDTYGMPHGTTDCDICYNATTGRKFWGFSIAIIQWSKVVGPTSQLAQLTNLEYSWVLRQPNPDNPSEIMDISQSPKPPPKGAEMVRTIINVRPPNMQANHSESFTDHWYLDCLPSQGWTPMWKPAALAGVVIGSFVISILVSAVMVNRMHQLLAVQSLKEANTCLAITTQNLKEEKERLDALLERQYGLIAMFEKDSSSRAAADRKSGESVTMERIEAMRRTMAMGGGAPAAAGVPLQLQVLELLGEGTFGKVYKGLWRGTKVAIKTLILPANMSGAEKREKMAIMEAAISSSLSHPNIVQTYTYAVRPLQDTMVPHEPNSNLIITTASSTVANTFKPNTTTGYQAANTQSAINGVVPEGQPLCSGTPVTPATPGSGSATANGAGMATAHTASVEAGPAEGGVRSSPGQPGKEEAGTLTGTRKASNVHSYEVRLVLEYCDKGTLRDAVEQGAFFTRTGLNYLAILDTALDIAQAMLHLHVMDILHGDLKARNILLKSCGDEARGVIAKVGDFGLSVKIDQHATHISSVFQGTMTHMAPEVMLHGHISKAADVYAFGITLYELFTGSKPFHGVPGALLGHMITSERRRPAFPPMTPPEFKALAEQCWAPEPHARPTFEEIAAELSRIRAEKGGATAPLLIKVAPPSPLQPADVPANGSAAGPLPSPLSVPAAGASLDSGLPAIITSSVTMTRAGKQVRWLETLPEGPPSGSPNGSGSKLARLAIINASNTHTQPSGSAGSSSPAGAATAAAAALLGASNLGRPPGTVSPPATGTAAAVPDPPSRSSSRNLGSAASLAGSHSQPLARSSESNGGSSRRLLLATGGSSTPPQRSSGQLTPVRGRESPGAGDGASGSTRTQLGYVAHSSLEAEAPALIIGEMDGWAEDSEGGAGPSDGLGMGRPVGTMALSSNVVAQIGKMATYKPSMLPRIDEGSVGRTSSDINSFESRLLEQQATANASHHHSSGGSFPALNSGSNALG